MKEMMDFVNDMAVQFDSAIASNKRKNIIRQINCALKEISVHTDFVKAAYYYYIATAYGAIIPNGDTLVNTQYLQQRSLCLLETCGIMRQIVRMGTHFTLAGIYSGSFRIQLPGKPYMAVQLKRVDGNN